MLIISCTSIRLFRAGLGDRLIIENESSIDLQRAKNYLCWALKFFSVYVSFGSNRKGEG